MEFEQWWESKSTFINPEMATFLEPIAKHAWDASRENKQKDYEQLKDLTVTIWKRFYLEEAPEFEPLDEILGLISQIDNMVTGLERRKET